MTLIWRWLVLALLLTLGARALAEKTVIDILIVYDETAVEWVASEGGMELFAQDAVNRLNVMLDNSDVPIEARLVHVAAIPYRESGDMVTDLDVIRGGGPVGRYVAELRRASAADLVALFVRSSTPCCTGIGHLHTGTLSNAEFAYSVNSVVAVNQSPVFAHEIGHNLGAGHAKSQSLQPGPNSALNAYSAGWYFAGDNGFRYSTVMAYRERTPGEFFLGAPHFSSPLIQHRGAPTGHPEDGDNARTLRETQDVVSTYREWEVPVPRVLPPTEVGSNRFRAQWAPVPGADRAPVKCTVLM